MRVSLVSPSQHEVCQPNRKPLSNLFGDTMAYHMYRGYGIVDTTTGGKREIRTHGTLLFFGFQDRCNKPDSANFPRGSWDRTRTYNSLVNSQMLYH